ncbi:MAG TPA: DUF1801 domain-containing protein [Candidatus Polarisedimenticolaceae bacterium]
MASKQTLSGTAAVEAFLDTLDHPRKAEILAIRKIILEASSDIGEGIKWNAPSFHTHEFFATFHLRPRDCVQLIFHRGAKVGDGDVTGEVPDPLGLTERLGSDRCTAKFRDMADVNAKRRALSEFVKEWIARL